jgi:SAM-dependent methyltransferase
LNIFSAEARQFIQVCRTRIADSVESAKCLKWGVFADDFLKRFLGAQELHTLDYSNYEGADIVHDLNVPTPSSFDERFDVVIDGGTLEHVFNIPVAWESCMRMLKVGGHLFIFTPANNFCGHGFYQFSPELFFRLLDASNGFCIEDIMLAKHGIRGWFLLDPACYRVIDPAVARARSMLYTDSRVLCLVHARKISRRSLERPLQSDYVTMWSGNGVGRPHESAIVRLLRHLHAAIPPYPRRLSLEYYQKYFAFSLRNKRFYRRVPYLDFSDYR